MAIAALATGTQAFVNGVNSISFAVNTTGGTNTGIIVCYQTNQALGVGNVTGFTHNGKSFTKLYEQLLTNGGDVFGYWYLANADAGNYNVIGSSTSNTYWIAMAAAYSGTDTSSLIDTSDFLNRASDIALSINLTASVANDWYVSFYAYPSGTAPTSSATNRVATGNDNIIFDSNGTLSVGVNNMTITPPAGQTRELMYGALIKPAASSAIKTFNGLANASTKTVNGLARASVKTWNGLT